MHPLTYATIAHHAQRLRLIRIKDWADARYLATSRKALARAVSEGRVDLSALEPLVRAVNEGHVDLSLFPAFGRRGRDTPTRRDDT